MRVGIFSVVDHYPAELRRSGSELYGELLDQAEAADALGFDSFWIAEHHFHEYGAIPRPPVWLAAAAERSRAVASAATAERTSSNNSSSRRAMRSSAPSARLSYSLSSAVTKRSAPTSVCRRTYSGGTLAACALLTSMA